MEGNQVVTNDNWNGGVQVEDLQDAGPTKDEMKWNSPLPMPALTILKAEEAREFVLANAGATLPRRDAVDLRVTEQAKTGIVNVPAGVTPPQTQFKHRRMALDSYKLGIITDVTQVGGYPEYKGLPYADFDADGIPDAWETSHKLNPKDASDASKPSKSGSGYSNIEDYLNSVVPMEKVQPIQRQKK